MCSDSPIDDELVVGCGLVTHGAHPRGLLLVHLQVEHGVEALQVGAGLRTAGHGQPHLHQLQDRDVRMPSQITTATPVLGTPGTHRADQGHPHSGGGDLAVWVQAKLLLDCEVTGNTERASEGRAARGWRRLQGSLGPGWSPAPDSLLGKLPPSSLRPTNHEEGPWGLPCSARVLLACRAFLERTRSTPWGHSNVLW